MIEIKLRYGETATARVGTSKMKTVPISGSLRVILEISFFLSFDLLKKVSSELCENEES